MRRGWLVGLIASGIVLGAAEHARAHPHVFIEARNVLVFDDAGQIVALRVEWTFDEFYSAWAVEGLDANGDGQYSSEELQTLARENAVNLEEYDYFTKVRLAQEPLGYGAVTEYRSELSDGLLSLHMTLPLAAPVDPQTDQFNFASYDPTFYIAMILAQTNPVTFSGAAPAGCGFTVREPQRDANGAYIPDDQAIALASTEIGALYAQTVDVVCEEH